MASTLIFSQPEVQLPGELPKALRSKPCLSRSRALSTIPSSHSPCKTDCKRSSDSGASVHVWPRGEESSKDFRQVGQGESNGDIRGDENGPILECDRSSDDDPLKVLRRLDKIIDRLLSSCSARPEVSLPPTDNRKENPPNVQELEDHLEGIIKMLSQRGHFKRCDREELLVATVAAKPNELERAGSSTTPDSLARKSAISPITPRSLFTRSSSAEKRERTASPPAARSSSRSGRFTAALSFLSSPRRAGITSLRIASPSSNRTQDLYRRHEHTTPDRIKI